MPEATEELLTAEELSSKLKGRLKPRTLRKQARDGWIPGRRIGKAWFFKWSEVDAKMNENGRPK